MDTLTETHGGFIITVSQSKFIGMYNYQVTIGSQLVTGMLFADYSSEAMRKTCTKLGITY